MYTHIHPEFFLNHFFGRFTSFRVSNISSKFFFHKSQAFCMKKQKCRHSFIIKKINLNCLFGEQFFYQFVNNFLTLLCKINGLDIFNIVDFFQIFVTSGNSDGFKLLFGFGITMALFELSLIS